MGKIVAIGGGSMEEHETLAIDREVVRLSATRSFKTYMEESWAVIRTCSTFWE